MFTKLKRSFPLIFLTVSTTLMVVFFLSVSPKTGLANLLYDGSELTVELSEERNAEISWSDNIFFKDAITETTEDGSAEFSDVTADTVYVKVQPIAEENTHIRPSYYKVVNHEHIFELNSDKSKAPECEVDGYDYIECTECDSVKSNTIEMLGHDLMVAGYKATSCTEDGHTLWRCQRCGKFEKVISEKVDHGYAFTEHISKSTCVVQGEDRYNCIGCGLEKIEKVAYAAHSYVYNGEFANDSAVGVNLSCSVCGKSGSKSFSRRYDVGSYQGVLHMPSLGITVPVYLGSQATCDATNSASLQRYGLGVRTIICDHYFQANFTNISRAVPGQTVLYYQGQKYICSERASGVNNRRDLVFDNGTCILNGGSQLYLYTCKDRTAYPIWIIGFNRV